MPIDWAHMTGPGAPAAAAPAAPDPFETWYNAGIANGSIGPEYPKDQWRAWFGNYDAKCPANAPFHSEREGANGACVEKPVDCPDGMVNFGMKCVGTNDPRLGAGAAGSKGVAAAAQPAEPPRPMTLQDVLTNMFTQRSGIFGFPGGREPGPGKFAGTLGVDQYGNPLPTAPDLTSQSLSGGGLIWGPAGTDLSAFSGSPATPATSAVGGGGGGGKDYVGSISPLGGALGSISTGMPQTPQTAPLSLPPLPSGAVFSNAVDRSNPANVMPFGGGGGNTLEDMLAGSGIFGRRRNRTSPLAQALAA